MSLGLLAKAPPRRPLRPLVCNKPPTTWPAGVYLTCALTQIGAQSPGCLRNIAPTRGDLKDGERGALRIGHDGDAADVFEVGGRHVESCAELIGFFGRSVTIGNGKVGQPVRRNTRLILGSGRNATDEVLAVLDVPITVRGVFVFFHHAPTKQVGIELAGPRLIRRAQIGPA